MAEQDGIEITSGLELYKAQANLDTRYGAWASIAAANVGLDPSRRDPGLTIGVDIAGTITEYWYRDGIADIDLIPKAGTSWVSNLIVSDASTIQNTATSDITAQTGITTFTGIDWDVTKSGRVSTGKVSLMNFKVDGTSVFHVESVNGSAHVDIGDHGVEDSGIDVDGIIYNTALRVNDQGDTNPAQFIIHRHSTTLAPVILGARSNSNTTSHAAVTTGQSILGLYGAGWTGTHYDLFASIDFEVDAGTISATSAPSRIVFKTVTDGTTILTEGLRIDNASNITIPNGKLTVTDRLALGLTAGDVATPLEGEIWYNNTTNKFRAFENATAIDMIGGGSYLEIANNLSDLQDASVARTNLGITLQTSYDVFTANPEILTDATRGAVTVRRGSALDTDNIIEGQNGAGTVTFSIDGDGNVNYKSQLIAPFGTQTAPSIAFEGELDTGLHLRSPGIIAVPIDGVSHFNFNFFNFTAENASGLSLRDQAASSTVATLMLNRSGPNNNGATGLGGNTGEVSIINNSIETLKADASNNVTIPNGKLTVTDRLALGLTAGDVATPLEGEIWYNNTTNKFRAFENATAIDMIGGGGGDVTKVGTPVDNQVGVWTGDGTLEGSSLLLWDETTKQMTIGSTTATEYGLLNLIGNSTAATKAQIRNDGSGSAFLDLRNTASSGDVYAHYASGTSRYSVGVDNSDSNIFKINASTGADITPSAGTTVLAITGGGLMGVFGATPIAQQVHIADATDAATAISQLNLLLAQWAAFGFQASV